MRSNVRHVLCPSTPETNDDEASTVVNRRGFTVVNVTSTSDGHAFKSKPTFGFQPKIMFGLTTATEEDSVFIASTSQTGARNVINDSIFLLSTCLKEKRKFEYPPTRNSPGSKTTFAPKVTLGPTSSIVSEISSQDTSFLPSLEEEEEPFGSICPPQHAKTNSSFVSVRTSPRPKLRPPRQPLSTIEKVTLLRPKIPDRLRSLHSLLSPRLKRTSLLLHPRRFRQSHRVATLPPKAKTTTCAR